MLEHRRNVRSEFVSARECLNFAYDIKLTLCDIKLFEATITDTTQTRNQWNSCAFRRENEIHGEENQVIIHLTTIKHNEQRNLSNGYLITAGNQRAETEIFCNETTTWKAHSTKKLQQQGNLLTIQTNFFLAASVLFVCSFLPVFNTAPRSPARQLSSFISRCKYIKLESVSNCRSLLSNYRYSKATEGRKQKQTFFLSWQSHKSLAALLLHRPYSIWNITTC